MKTTLKIFAMLLIAALVAYSSYVKTSLGHSSVYTVDTIPEVSLPTYKDVSGLDSVHVTYYSAFGESVNDDSVSVAAYFHKDVDPSRSVFNPHSATKLRWCAISQDLLWYNSGPLRYGDTIRLSNVGDLSGDYVVKDCMAPHMKQRVDILLNLGQHHQTGKWRSKIELKQ